MAGAIRYAVDEATASLWRGRQVGFIATGTIAVALFVLGGFLILTANLERLSGEWSKAAELSVFLKDEITPPEEGKAKVRVVNATSWASRLSRTSRRWRRLPLPPARICVATSSASKAALP